MAQEREELTPGSPRRSEPGVAVGPVRDAGVDLGVAAGRGVVEPIGVLAVGSGARASCAAGADANAAYDWAMADEWSIAASIGTMLGGFGAAAGAWFARSAAEASRATARDAGEALALATKPLLHVSPWGKFPGEGWRAWGVKVELVAGGTATDVEVVVTTKSGDTVQGSASEIVPGGELVVEGGRPYPEGGWQTVVKSVDVRYGDQRRHVRWHLRVAEDEGGLFQHSDERIS